MLWMKMSFDKKKKKIRGKSFNAGLGKKRLTTRRLSALIINTLMLDWEGEKD